MKTILCNLCLALAVVIGNNESAAQGTHFFRITGPAESDIRTFQADGTLVWSNTLPGTNYLIQTISSLSGTTNWLNFIKVPAASGMNTNRLGDYNSTNVLALIPAGSFTMGDALDNEADAMPTVSVTVSAFYMDVNLVTHGQWQLVFNWATNHGYKFDYNSTGGKSDNQPDVNVGWWDAVRWCNARSEQAGLSPVYFTDAGLTQVFNAGDVPLFVNWTNRGYRLPTEAEWEKAARGGLTGQRFPWGNTVSEAQANYNSDTDTNYDLGPKGFNTAGETGGSPYTTPAGYFPANGYGLTDMAGNVWEWCWDWYGTPYTGGTDPRGPASGTYRVVRGGDWANNAFFVRCADRNATVPNNGASNLGYRCVRGF